LISDDSCNIEDHSRITVDVSRTCANHTLRESSVKSTGRRCHFTVAGNFQKQLKHFCSNGHTTDDHLAYDWLNNIIEFAYLLTFSICDNFLLVLTNFFLA